MHSSLAFLRKRKKSTPPQIGAGNESSGHDVKNNSDEVLSNNYVDSPVRLHFNLWDVYTDRNSKATFLDVGLHIDNVSLTEEFMIFFPFEFDSSEVIDLHGCLSTDSELVRTIFNENLSFDSITHSLSFVSYDGKVDNRFFIHSIPLSNPKMVFFEKKQYQYNGGYLISTLMNFSKDFLECIHRSQSEQKNNHRESDAGYFRFRIPLKAREVFISEYKPKHALLTGSLYKSEIVDFRVNEARSLPPELYYEKDVRQMDFCASRVDYFLVKDAWCEYQTSHGDFKKSRTLEKSFWSKYLLFKIKVDNLSKVMSNKDAMVIYHWSKSPKENNEAVSFSAFAKFIEQSTSRVTIGYYIAAIIVISIISNFLSDFIKGFLCSGS